MFFRHHARSVLVLMVYQAKSASGKEKSDNSQDIDEDLALFATLILKDHNKISIARQVVLKAMCETIMIVSVNLAGPVMVDLH